MRLVSENTSGMQCSNDNGRPAFPEEWVSALFICFQGIWFHKWSSCVPNELVYQAALSEWSRGLTGITPKEVQGALDEAIRTSDGWPPSLPEFLKLCRLASGIPNYLDAYENAKQVAANQGFYSASERDRVKYLHPAIEMAYHKMTSFDFRNMTQKDVEHIWREKYEQAVKEWENEQGGIKKIGHAG